MLLRHIYGFQPSLLHSLQENILPYSRIRKPWAPVPAKHAVCFSDLGKSVHTVFRSHSHTFRIALPYIFDRTVKRNLQTVFSPHEHPGHGVCPCAVHIVSPAQQASIQINVCNGVQTVKTKSDLICIKKSALRCEPGFIDKILFHPFQGFILVVPPEGIFHPARAKQVIVNRPRHLGGNPLLFSLNLERPPLCNLLSPHISFILQSCLHPSGCHVS